MKIAIIGTGNVGGALAKRLSENHTIYLGVRDTKNFKGIELLKNNNNISAHLIMDAVKLAEVIIISVPAKFAIETASILGDVSQKVIIDTMNSGVSHTLENFDNTTDALLAHCNAKDIVKCFNTTGYENILNPIYHEQGIDMFTAGDSQKGVEIATQLAKETGFENVYHFGGNSTFHLIEQMAMCWINLAIVQKQGRDMAFKVIRRRFSWQNT
jgi:8-hydroxy-5-deazaflavin:NADPH oxidoreductase